MEYKIVEFRREYKELSEADFFNGEKSSNNVDVINIPMGDHGSSNVIEKVSQPFDKNDYGLSFYAAEMDAVKTMMLNKYVSEGWEVVQFLSDSKVLLKK